MSTPASEMMRSKHVPCVVSTAEQDFYESIKAYTLHFKCLNYMS